MPAIAERLPAKYLVKAEAPKIIASREQHEAYIQRLLKLQRKAHRTAEETETAKLLVVLIADYEAKQFTIAKRTRQSQERIKQQLAAIRPSSDVSVAARRLQLHVCRSGGSHRVNHARTRYSR